MRLVSYEDTKVSMADIWLKVCQSIPSSTSANREIYKWSVDNILNLKPRETLNNNSKLNTQTQNTREKTKTNIFSIFG